MSASAEVKVAEEEIQTVNPWTATSANGFNYLKLIEKFGCSPIDGAIINRFEKVTKTKAHPWLRRGIFFSHKDLNLILDDVEAGRPVYLYTGRGPTSDSMHLGHMIPFMLTAFLQRALGAICIIQISDDEKYYFKEAGTLAYYNELGYKNAKDIIACGFDLNRTYIFSNLEAFGADLYKVTAQIMKATTGNQIRGIYGITLDNNIGQLVWPCMQAAPAFSQCLPEILGEKPVRCLVAMAIDQAPYFRMARDFATPTSGFMKPAEIHTKFLVGLGGVNDKMSSTALDSTQSVIFLTDSEKDVVSKIKKYAFSGGAETLELHRKNGGNLTTDVSYQYLLHFEYDDAKLKEIATDYKNGKLTSGQIKALAAAAVWKFVEHHQKKKAEITDEYLMKFYDTKVKRYYEMVEESRGGPVALDIDPTRKDGERVKETGVGFDFDPYFGLL